MKRLVLLLLIACSAGCQTAPKSVQLQHVEGIKDIEKFGKNTAELINRLARKLQEVSNQKAMLETELAIEQEVIEVEVLVSPAKDNKPAVTTLRKYLTVETVSDALDELTRLQKTNSLALWKFLDDWVVIKGDLKLALARARLIRTALELQGVSPEGVRSFADGLVNGLGLIEKPAESGR